MILVYIFVLVLKGICLSGKSIFYIRIKYTHQLDNQNEF